MKTLLTFVRPGKPPSDRCGTGYTSCRSGRPAAGFRDLLALEIELAIHLAGSTIRPAIHPPLGVRHAALERQAQERVDVVRRPAEVDPQLPLVMGEDAVLRARRDQNPVRPPVAERQP